MIDYDYELKQEINKGYVDLGFAIVLQAIEDTMEGKPKIRKAAYQWLKNNSSEITLLCGMSNKLILQRLGKWRG